MCSSGVCGFVCVVCVCGVSVCVGMCEGDGSVVDRLLALDRLSIFVFVYIFPGTSTLFDSNFIISDLILLSFRCLGFELWVWGWAEGKLGLLIILLMGSL